MHSNYGGTRVNVYRIKDWNIHFENNKSREIDACSFVCLPNKQHGMGFRRIMAEKDGATIYGIWICIVAACSQQKAPRQGWLTEDGRRSSPPWDYADIALKIGRSAEEIERCLSVVASPRVGWMEKLEVPTECPRSVGDSPSASPHGILEQNRTEGTEGKGTEQKESLVESAEKILEHLNIKASREFRPTTENLKLIRRRLEEVDGDVDGVKIMIDRMCAKWKTDEKMSEFLRPETLFGKTKFSGYYDMRNLSVRADAAPDYTRDAIGGAQ
jgi:uncharacterized phage protein (TIGR02220 family)